MGDASGRAQHLEAADLPPGQSREARLLGMARASAIAELDTRDGR